MKGEFQLRLKYKGHGGVIEFGRSHQLELYNCNFLFKITYFLQINLFDFSTTITKLSTEVHNREVSCKFSRDSINFLLIGRLP